MLNTKPNSIDELGMLLAQIAVLTKQADKIKDEMKNIASAGGATVFEGTLFKSTYMESNRKVTDYKELCKNLGISDAVVAAYTSTTAVFSIKTTSR